MARWIILVFLVSMPAGHAAVDLDISPRADAVPALDSHFLGLSYEKSKLATPFFQGTNQALCGLFARLGNGVLRIGANAVDKTSWNQAGPGLLKGEVAPADVDRLAAFARRTGWKIVYGLNFASNTPAKMVAEATYAAKALGPALESFELGNEPDLYSRNGLRPPSFGYAQFRAEWESYAAAIHLALPNAAITGPATTMGVDYFNKPFSHDEGGKISQLTHHYYRGDGQSPGSTIELLLGGDPRLDAIFAGLRSNAKGISGGFRLAEANSFYNGGAPGVSNAFAAALWSLEFLFLNAVNGSRGVNFHGGNGPGANGGVPDEHAGGGYTPILDDGKGNVIGVRPVFYGMAFFGLAAQGELLEAKFRSANASLSAFAVKAPDGELAIALVNKSATDVAAVTVHSGQALRQARLLLLAAPTLASTTGVTLGGAPIDTSGNWTGEFVPVPVRASELAVEVPAASAVLLKAK